MKIVFAARSSLARARGPARFVALQQHLVRSKARARDDDRRLTQRLARVLHVAGACMRTRQPQQCDARLAVRWIEATPEACARA
jgi:hypothetical protein